MACVKRRRNRWVVDFRDHDGRRRWESYKTREQADDALKRRIGELKSGTYTPPTAVPTFRELAADWLETKRGKHPATFAGYQTEVELHLVPALGELKVTELRTAHLEHFRDDRRKAGLAPVTVNKLLTRAGAILKLAQRRDLIAANPAKVAERVEGEVKEVTLGYEDVGDEDGAVDPETVPTPAQVKAILDHAEGQYRAYLTAAALTGARPSELTALTWSDVDLEARVIRIRRAVTWARERGTKGRPQHRFFQPKTKSGRRDIPIPAELVSALRTWKLACPPTADDLVFPSDAGTPKHRSTIAHKGLGPAIKAAEVPHFKLYAFRHFYASWLILRREPDTSVARKMGHADANVTRRIYAHWFKDASLETGAVDELGAVLSGSR